MTHICIILLFPRILTMTLALLGLDFTQCQGFDFTQGFGNMFFFDFMRVKQALPASHLDLKFDNKSIKKDSN